VANKHRNLYLALTLICFFGIIIIFVVGGYLGVYDTIIITAGERPQKIEPDFWLHPDATYEVWTSWGEKVFFTDEIANHQFTDYSAEVSAAVWRSQEKVRDLVTQQVTIKALNEAQVEWSVDTAELVPEGLAQGQYVQFSIIVERGNAERKIILTVNPGSYPPVPAKPILPPRPAQPS
jgi:hypothetical protein